MQRERITSRLKPNKSKGFTTWEAWSDTSLRFLPTLPNISSKHDWLPVLLKWGSLPYCVSCHRYDNLFSFGFRTATLLIQAKPREATALGCQSQSSVSLSLSTLNCCIGFSHWAERHQLPFFSTQCLSGDISVSLNPEKPCFYKLVWTILLPCSL